MQNPAQWFIQLRIQHDPTAAMAPGEKAKVELSSLNEVRVGEIRIADFSAAKSWEKVRGGL
jgi:hypothetical protein